MGAAKRLPRLVTNPPTPGRIYNTARTLYWYYSILPGIIQGRCFRPERPERTMWKENLKDGRTKFCERYINPMTGKAQRVSITLDKDNRNTRKEAERILAQKIAQAQDGQGNRMKGYSLKELTDLYFTHQKRSLAIGTADRNYRSLTTTINMLGSDTLAEKLSAKYINECFELSGRESGTLNEFLRRLKAMLRWAYDNDYVSDISYLAKVHPFKDVPHKLKIQEKYLDRGELSRLVDNMAPQPCWQLLTKFLAFSGLRFGEACALERSDVDLDALEIHVTKQYDSLHGVTNPAKSVCSIRDVHIQPELLEVCRSILAFMDRRRLFYGLGKRVTLFMFSTDGGHIQYMAYHKYLQRHALKVTGKNITPHALRHSHASLLYEAGFSVDEVSRRLGHENSDITREVYLHVTRRLKEKDNQKLDGVRILSGT